MIRPPYISYDRDVEYIDNQQFLAGLFGEQRPLTGQEIMHLYANMQITALVEALMLGFEQVVTSNEVNKYLDRGKKIANKHMEHFTKLLKKDDLPTPMTLNPEVTTSTTSPFSDKLMLYHMGFLSCAGIGDYGMALSFTHRRDISGLYTRIMGEIGKYAEDGANIMIENQWMERPPHAPDRDELTKKKQ